MLLYSLVIQQEEKCVKILNIFFLELCQIIHGFKRDRAILRFIGSDGQRILVRCLILRALGELGLFEV